MLLLFGFVVCLRFYFNFTVMNVQTIKKLAKSSKIKELLGPIVPFRKPYLSIARSGNFSCLEVTVFDQADEHVTSVDPTRFFALEVFRQGFYFKQNNVALHYYIIAAIIVVLLLLLLLFLS